MYVIIGGKGYLGSYIIKNIRQNSHEKIIASYHSDKILNQIDGNIIWQLLDIANEKSIQDFVDVVSKNKKRDEEVKCVYVIGYIRPDNCVKNPELAIDINIRGLVNFLKYAKNVLNGLIFTSTDFVAGESINDYKFKETDIASPVNLFGMIKYTCETIVLSQGYNVVRLPFMFGKSLIPEKPHFIEHIERVIRNKENFDVLSDYYETSLDYDTVANCIFLLFEKYGTKIPEPIINIVGDDKISKYEIAINYAQKNNLDTSYIKPLPLKEADFFVAKRCTILLDNTLLKKLLNKDKIQIKY